MVLARVRGTVVSTHKPESMGGLRLLLLEKVDAVTLKGKGDYVVGIDSVGANAGEIVFYVTGSSARMTDTTKGKPSDATIIAIVDVIEKDGTVTYDAAEGGSGNTDGTGARR
jgi:microcompartment protein CcmK/EutM